MALADIDSDGDLDLWVGRRGTNRIYENRWLPDGTLTFQDVSEAWGMPDDLYKRTMGAVFGDPDADGDLDLYEINHAWCFPGATQPEEGADAFFRNEGGTYVRDDSVLPDDFGAYTGRMGFSGLWLDYDRDLDLDLLVVNDFVVNGGPSALFRNLDAATLTFEDASAASGFGLHPDPFFKGVNGMGIDIGDLNGDEVFSQWLEVQA